MRQSHLALGFGVHIVTYLCFLLGSSRTLECTATREEEKEKLSTGPRGPRVKGACLTEEPWWQPRLGLCVTEQNAQDCSVGPWGEG